MSQAQNQKPIPLAESYQEQPHDLSLLAGYLGDKLQKAHQLSPLRPETELRELLVKIAVRADIPPGKFIQMLNRIASRFTAEWYEEVARVRKDELSLDEHHACR